MVRPRPGPMYIYIDVQDFKGSLRFALNSGSYALYKVLESIRSPAARNLSTTRSKRLLGSGRARRVRDKRNIVLMVLCLATPDQQRETRKPAYRGMGRMLGAQKMRPAFGLKSSPRVPQEPCSESPQEMHRKTFLDFMGWPRMPPRRRRRRRTDRLTDRRQTTDDCLRAATKASEQQRNRLHTGHVRKLCKDRRQTTLARRRRR